jgi:hypothetical protein
MVIGWSMKRNGCVSVFHAGLHLHLGVAEKAFRSNMPSAMAYDTALMFRGLLRDGMLGSPAAADRLVRLLDRPLRTYRAVAEETVAQWRSISEVGPGGIAQMLVHGFARSAFARIVFGLHETQLPASLVDDFVVVKGVLLCNAIGNTQ